MRGWEEEYIKRVKEELKLGKTSPSGKRMVVVHVYDLLEESKMSKREFFDRIFLINECIGNVVLYLK